MANGRAVEVAREDAHVERLLGLLLVDALQTLARGPHGTGVPETRAWVCAPADAHTYSFERACDAFGLPPRMLRRRLGLRGPTRTVGRPLQRAPRP